MYGKAQEHYARTLEEIRAAGLEKRERQLTSPQGATIRVRESPGPVLNFCANNYLGLSSHPKVLEAAHRALDEYGFGLSSVRFICGTQDAHKKLESKIASFLGVDDAILYSSCFDANGGIFETLLGEEDAVISDALNHASIIDGIRLSKAQRYRYANRDMVELEQRLNEASGARFKLVVTDGVFSMDGYLAPLPEICALAEKYGALTMIDDSHAVGFIGPRGRGTHEHHGVMGRIDIISGTLGKALGGASGGYIAGRREIVDLLRQRSRPYLFSNSLAPSIAAAGIAALDLLESADELRTQLRDNTAFFRESLTRAGFDILPGDHPIVPLMIGDANAAVRMSQELLDLGVYAIAFAYPVVPMGKARIRFQVSAAHRRSDLDMAVEALMEARRRL